MKTQHGLLQIHPARWVFLFLPVLNFFCWQMVDSVWRPRADDIFFEWIYRIGWNVTLSVGLWSFVHRYRIKTPANLLLLIPGINAMRLMMNREDKKVRALGLSLLSLQISFCFDFENLFQKIVQEKPVAELLQSIMQQSLLIWFTVSWAKFFTQQLIGDAGAVFRPAMDRLDEFRKYHFSHSTKSGYRHPAIAFALLFVLLAVFTILSPVVFDAKYFSASAWINGALFGFLLFYGFAIFRFFEPAVNLDFKNFHYEGLYAIGFIIPVYNLIWALTTPFRLKKAMWDGFGNFGMARSFVVPRGILALWAISAFTLVFIADLHLITFTAESLIRVEPWKIFSLMEWYPSFITYPVLILASILTLISTIQKSGSRQLGELMSSQTEEILIERG
jgi:hypothetical protein